jgi:16S rRNA (guanine527-N7)-methyltransferase
MATEDGLEQRVEQATAPLVALAPAQVQQLADYLNLLERWNRVHNLTAVRDIGTMIDRHLTESLAVGPWLMGEDCCDAGSGAGLPGLPLAVAHPQRRFQLVERAGKKAAFLEHVAQQLKLDNLQVVHSDLKDFRPAQGFATVLARALAPLPRLIPMVAHLLAHHGRLVALKGPAAEKELEQLPRGFQLAAMQKLPLGGRDSRVVVITAEDETQA